MPTLAGQLPDDTNIYAAEGSAAHEVAQRSFLPHPPTGTLALRDPYRLVGEVIKVDRFEIIVTTEMVDAVKVYLDYCMENVTNGDQLKIEERLRLNDDVWGTGDFIRFRPKTGELLVADYKHGEGVWVPVYQNPQLLLYALMACKLYKGVKKIRIAIVQPRCGTDDFIREWEVDPVTLLEFEADIIDAVARTKEPEPDLNYGKHCTFCKARAQCPLLVDMAQKRARELFNEMKMALKPVELGTRRLEVEALRSHLTAVENFAEAEAKSGRPVPGFKLVRKQGNRTFTNENEVADVLLAMGVREEDIWERKLKSPAQIEKIIKKKGMTQLEEFIIKPDNGIGLVHESDNREEFFPGSAAEAFTPQSLEDLLG